MAEGFELHVESAVRGGAAVGGGGGGGGAGDDDMVRTAW